MTNYKRHAAAKHKQGRAQRIDFTILMTIYCDRERGDGEVHVPAAQYYGASKGDCKEKAFLDGWIVRHSYTGTCPICCQSLSCGSSAEEQLICK